MTQMQHRFSDLDKDDWFAVYQPRGRSRDISKVVTHLLELISLIVSYFTLWYQEASRVYSKQIVRKQGSK